MIVSTPLIFYRYIARRVESLILVFMCIVHQLGAQQTFEDVCPLFDLMDGVANYTQHVRIASELQLTTRNLPDTVSTTSLMYLMYVEFTLTYCTGAWI